jgi:hypothetical protein
MTAPTTRTTTGHFLRIASRPPDDLPVPGERFIFGQLEAAQAEETWRPCGRAAVPRFGWRICICWSDDGQAADLFRLAHAAHGNTGHVRRRTGDSQRRLADPWMNGIDPDAILHKLQRRHLRETSDAKLRRDDATAPRPRSKALRGGTMRIRRYLSAWLVGAG